MDTLISTADHTLTNLQLHLGGAVTANADTTLYNLDSIAATSTGLTGSSFTLSGNATYAEASSNRASNTLTLDASSLDYASAGMVNNQYNAAAVTATAASSATLGLNGDTTAAAISNSTVALEDNSTTALARGNSASNVLNVSGGAGFGSSTVGASASLGASPSEASATYAVLNLQGNHDVVSASSTGSTYLVAYNADPTTFTGVTGSTVSVSGNSVASEAYGNSATNALQIFALNGVSPTAAVANTQLNTAATSASVTGAGTASFGATGYGGATGSSFGVTGNTVSARAVGNSASSSITSASR